MASSNHTRRFADFLRENAALGRSTEVAPGTRLFAVGDPDDSMYFVESGAVDLVFKHGKKTIRAEGFFGDLALLLDSHERTAAAMVAEPSRLLEFDRAAFEELLDRDPRLMMEVLRHGCVTLLESERNLVSDLGGILAIDVCFAQRGIDILEPLGSGGPVHLFP